MKQIRFNAFDMSCVGHISAGTWRHPENQAHRYKELAYWTDLAKLLERGLFDGIFIADVLGTYDVYGSSNDAALRHAAQVPVTDPLLVISAMAAVTEHLGFGVTAGTAYEHPYPFARRMSTLDHLTNGRVGWNVVTGYLPSAARNMGSDDQRDHDARYDHADEYLEVLYKLWEGSWEDDAVVQDRESGVYTDPAKVHPIGHVGTHFTVPGIHLVEPSPQRTPVIFQAGTSSRGVRFAAEHAEAIFIGAPTKAVLGAQVRAIRTALVDAGRAPDAARIYAMATIVVDETPAKAEAKYAELLEFASPEAALVLTSGWMGIDLSRYGLDDPIGIVQSNAIQSTVASFQQENPDGREWTVRDIAEYSKIGGYGPVFVGSASEVADEIQEWVEETDIDGLNISYAITPGTFEDVVTHLVPELQRRGVYQTSYAEGALRNKLHGRGDRLPEEHRGHSYTFTALSTTA